MNILNVTFLVSMNICPTGFKPNKFEFIFFLGGGWVGVGGGGLIMLLFKTSRR